MQGDIFDQMEAKAKRRHGDLGDTTAAARAMSQQPEKPGALRRAGSSLKQVGADINAELPVIGGTLGAALGAETGPGALGTAALGAAGGRALQQALNPVFGAEAPADPMQAYGQQAMSAFTAGAGPGAAEAGLQAGLPRVANALGRISIGQGWGDPQQMADTMLRYGIRNTKGGYERIKALVQGLSEKHVQGLLAAAKEKHTWNAIQDYMTPALAPIRTMLFNTNFPRAPRAALYGLIREFMHEHQVPIPKDWLRSNFDPHREMMRQVVSQMMDLGQQAGIIGEKEILPPDLAKILQPQEQPLNLIGVRRDRIIGPYQLNAMKEDADAHLRLLRAQMRQMTMEVPPAMTMQEKAYEALGNQARTLMYGPAEADGIRRGGPLEHLAPYDKEQHLLLNLKEAIGPQARKNVDAAAKMAEMTLKLAPYGLGGFVVGQGNVPQKMAFGLGAAAAGGVATNPTVTSLMAEAANSNAIPPTIANLIRYISQVYDVSHAPKQP